MRFNSKNDSIFEQKLEEFTGKTYPMGIEQFLLQKAENKGIEKGIEKEKIHIIRKLRLDKKMSIEEIANIVELKPERVRLILDNVGIE